MKVAALSAFLMLACAPMAYAQTCASPTALASNTVVNGNTCGGEIGINMGGVIFGHPSVVYSFTWTDQGVDPNIIDLTGTNMAFVVGPDCTQAPIAFGGPGVGPLDLTAAGFVDGQSYVLVVSTDPGLPVTDPPTCGDFVLSPGTLPVSLQNFTVQ